VCVATIHGPARQGDIRHSVADIAYAQSKLDFSVQTLFAAGLRATVEWFEG